MPEKAGEEDAKDQLAGNSRKMKEIEDELARTKYNKHTQAHIGRLKAKLAQLKAARARGGGRKGYGYGLRKIGDATVILVGFPSVGKSTLINRLTNADSKVGAYDFTTVTVIPGMLEYNGAKIQVLDIPGLITEGAHGRGRGREIISVVRNTDLIVMVLDPRNPERQMEVITNELKMSGMRLNQQPPDVKITPKSHGGIHVRSSSPELDERTAKEILQEFKCLNADIVIGKSVTVDDFIDAFMKNRVYVKAIYALNKSDMGSGFSLEKDFIRISAADGTNIDRLKEMIWDRLGLMRVYLKRIGKGPDMREPMIIWKGATVTDVCRRIHGDLVRKLEYAKVWGSSVKFAGQRVGVDWRLFDGDVVELHM